MKTGNTRRNIILRIDTRDASMEPGHEDREYAPLRVVVRPVLRASMEPGHEDREYGRSYTRTGTAPAASMEPGHEDREYWTRPSNPSSPSSGLNGARS